MKETDAMQRPSHSSDWTPIQESPVSWLVVYPDGRFRIGSVLLAQKDALRCSVGAIRVSKEAGDGAALTLSAGERRVALLYRRGRWYRWQGRPAARPAAPAVPPAPPRVPDGPGSPRGWSLSAVMAPLVLLLLLDVGLAAGLAARGGQGGVGGWVAACRFDEATWLEGRAYHTLVTHSLVHGRVAEFFYCALGLLLFGWLVQRNVGSWRTLLLFAWSAALSVGFWQFIQTPLGQQVLQEWVEKAFRYVEEHHGPGVALTLLTWYLGAYQQMLSLRGPIAGAAGAVSGLMAFAVCRRYFYPAGRPVRWLTLAAGGAYVALGWRWVWPELLGEPAPYVLFVGGALAGWAFCFPDKALHHFGDSLASALQRRDREEAAA
jgi:membrane associated rhomboid family serine protease